MTGHAGDHATDHVADPSLLIERLENEVEYLRREAEDWKEEARRKDAIIMTMAQRIPELEPASEPRESPVTASEERGKGEASETERAGQGLSWWRRLLGS
jgi:hypothetical protein